MWRRGEDAKKENIVVEEEGVVAVVVEVRVEVEEVVLVEEEQHEREQKRGKAYANNKDEYEVVGDKKKREGEG